MWGWTTVETVWQDLRYALRMLRKMPAFTAVVVSSLALGIGLNSSVFSVLNALLLRPLPVPEPGRLVRIFQGRYGNTSYRNYRDLQAHTATLASLAAFSWPNPVALGVPTDGGAARIELQKLDPALPITGIKTMAEHLGFAFWGAEIGATLLGIFALIGLLLAAVGLYGVLAFVINRSIPEIGIRMALGASPGDVLRLFIRRGLALSALGAFAGTLAAIVTTRVLRSYLYGANPSNPATFASAAALLLCVALVACYLPSRRAARIEPLRALRYE